MIICSACGKQFDPGWSEEEAEQELAQNFPGFSKEECALVCDECYKEMGFA